MGCVGARWVVYVCCIPQPSHWSAYLDFGSGMERMEIDIPNGYIRKRFFATFISQL